MYITQSEYNILTGKTISLTDLYKYDSSLKGFLHPNNYMIEVFLEENGSYPTEIKFAMIEFIRYFEENASALEGIPINGATIGSTSVNYISDIAKYIYKGKISLPTNLVHMLKPTNVLSPLGYKKNTKFRGTPFNINDFLETTEVLEQGIVPLTSANSKVLIDMNTLTENLPSLDVSIMEISNEKVKDGILNTDPIYEVKTVTKGWLRNNRSDNNERSTLIIDPYDITGNLITLKQDMRVKYLFNGDETLYTCERFDTHLDYEGKVHHYFIYGE